MNVDLMCFFNWFLEMGAHIMSDHLLKLYELDLTLIGHNCSTVFTYNVIQGQMLECKLEVHI